MMNMFFIIVLGNLYSEKSIVIWALLWEFQENAKPMSFYGHHLVTGYQIGLNNVYVLEVYVSIPYSLQYKNRCNYKMVM